MNSSPTTWQKLLCQSFKDTKIKTSQTGGCSLFNIRHYIYLSLQNSGIENRSPFSLWQLIKIRIDSKGNPQQVQDLCINLVLNMQKPSFSLPSSNSYFVLLTIILSLVTLLTPITATTFKFQKYSHSILKITTIPWQDVESETISLPLTSDYLTAAIVYEATAEDKQLATINGASWILDQRDSAYSLQVLSVSNKNNLMQFCKKHDICSESAFYTTLVKGKKLVRLIYGSYPSHKSAKLAKSELSANLKGISPWARSFKQIKNEL